MGGAPEVAYAIAWVIKPSMLRAFGPGSLNIEPVALRRRSARFHFCARSDKEDNAADQSRGCEASNHKLLDHFELPASISFFLIAGSVRR